MVSFTDTVGQQIEAMVYRRQVTAASEQVLALVRTDTGIDEYACMPSRTRRVHWI